MNYILKQLENYLEDRFQTAKTANIRGSKNQFAEFHKGMY